MHKLSEICRILDIDFSGEDSTIEGIQTLADAHPRQLSFVTSDTYADRLSKTKAAGVLIEPCYLNLVPQGTMALITDEPHLKMAQASKLFRYIPVTKTAHPHMGEACDIDKRVRFGKDVTLGDNVTIMAGCYVGDGVNVGSNTLLYPNVTLYHHTVVGADCIVHSGAVVGADGYGFAQTREGKHIKIYHSGNVVIGDDVEIGANSTVDRAVFGSTVIRSGSKIDNLVQIAHNCDVGEDSLLVCQTALAGSTVLGKGVVMGGQSGATGHLKIGDGATIASRAGVTKSLPGEKMYGGFPAVEIRLWRKMQAAVARMGRRA